MQRLRIPAGWTILKNLFYDIEPTPDLEIEGLTPIDGTAWSLFDYELVYAEHYEQKMILDLGWQPEYSSEGEYVLNLVKESYSTNDPITMCRTRNKAEIVEAVYQAMLKTSMDNGDFEEKGFMLKALTIPSGWTMVHNQFFDIDLKSQIDKAELFGAGMLKLETPPHPQGRRNIDLSWQPAHDPSGKFVATLMLTGGDDVENPVSVMETTDIDEVPAIIKQLCSWWEPRPKHKRKRIPTLAG